MEIQINTDGGARGNPGPAAAAFVAKDENKETLMEKGVYLGETTNNVAEYNGLLLAYTWLIKTYEVHKFSAVNIVMDSELIVKQMRGEYQVKKETLKSLYEKVKKCQEILEHKRVEITYTAVIRKFNKAADSLVNKTLDENVK